MRVLAVDLGQRRVGLAISDVTRTLARPLDTLTISDAHDALERVVSEIAKLSAEDDGLATIVVGWPARLDGSAHAMTSTVAAFVDALRNRTPLPVVTIDERLTSHEAESRLAERQRDWRARKRRLDAAAAAIFLQDYLDHHASSR